MPNTKTAACAGKTTYANRKIADQIVAKMRKKSKLPLEVYRCKFCSNWHIGRG